MSRITIRRPRAQGLTKFIVYEGDKLVGTIHHHTPTDIRLNATIEAAWSVNWTSGRVDFADTLKEVRDTALKGPP